MRKLKTRFSPLDEHPWASWALLSAVLAVPLAMFCTRFHYFGDPVIDWGTEVYTAWRLSEGAVLYRDLGYLHGPLSPYLHAALFKVFGATRGALLTFNFFIYLGVLWALGRLLRAYLPERAVAAALVLVSLLVGFNQLTVGANYNFVTPYRYGLTHGFLLSLLSLLAWRRAVAGGASRGAEGEGAAASRVAAPGKGAARGPGQWYSGALAGFLAGLASFAKHEVFVALAFALVVSLVALWPRLGEPLRRVGELVLGFALAVALWVGFCALRGAGPGEALGWYWFPYSLIFNHEFRALPIYSASVEHVGPARAGYWLLVAAALSALLCGLRVALSLAEAKAKTSRRAAWIAWLPFGVSLAGLVAVAAWPRVLAWSQEIWALAPPACALALLVALREDFREARGARGDGRGRRKVSGAGGAGGAGYVVVLLAFAVGLSLKVFADVSLDYAGFLLGLPCVLFLAWAVFAGFPALAPSRFPVSPGRWAALVALFVGAPQVLEANLATLVQQREMAVTLTTPSGNFNYYPKRAELLGAVTKLLKEKHAAARTLTVLPEGSYLNFVLGKPSPLYFMSLMPDQLMYIYGEERVVRQMEESPAEVIVVLPRSTAEFGLGDFKAGYGARVYAWVQRAYALDPDSPAGAEIWVRR